jgi:UDP-GlcNAc:undecaprenyl-phosphate GlcNAc-1-phosphate transferase
MTMNLFLIFISSLIISMMLIPVLIRSAASLGVLDPPGERKMHAAPVARVGGIAFAAGALASLLLWAPVDFLFISYLIGASVILCFGVLDDRINLDPKDKLLAQLLAGLIVVGIGGVYLKTFPFWDGEISPWLGVPFTLLVLVAVTNAINLSDGLDGLAGGLCLLSFSGIAFLAYLSGDVTVIALSLSLLGGIFGFLRFNTYPARIFMGDGGSQFLGFSAAFATILLADPARGSYSPLIGLWVIGLPILDTVGVMGQRWREGRSLFGADKSHLHHRLLAAGFLHHQAVTLIYALQTMMVGFAALFHWRGEKELLIAYLSLAVGIFSVFFLANRGWLRFDLPARPDSSGSSEKDGGRFPLVDWPMRLLGVGVPLFLVLSVFVPARIPSDFGWLAIGLFGLLLVGFWVFRQSAPLLVRLGLYTGGAFVVYLSEQTTAGWPIEVVLNLFFGFLAILVVIAIRLNREEPFETTPLDYLVLFVALIVPVLPEIRISEISLGFLAAKLLVLFFAYELLMSRRSERLSQLGVVALWDLLALGLRALWV